MSVHLKTWAPLSVFTDWLQQAKPFTSQPVQWFEVGSLVVSMNRLPAGVIGQLNVGVGRKPETVVLNLVLGTTGTLGSKVIHWKLGSWALIGSLKTQDSPKAVESVWCWNIPRAWVSWSLPGTTSRDRSWLVLRFMTVHWNLVLHMSAHTRVGQKFGATEAALGQGSWQALEWIRGLDSQESSRNLEPRKLPGDTLAIESPGTAGAGRHPDVLRTWVFRGSLRAWNGGCCLEPLELAGTRESQGLGLWIMPGASCHGSSLGFLEPPGLLEPAGSQPELWESVWCWGRMALGSTSKVSHSLYFLCDPWGSWLSPH